MTVLIMRLCDRAIARFMFISGISLNQKSTENSVIFKNIKGPMADCRKPCSWTRTRTHCSSASHCEPVPQMPPDLQRGILLPKIVHDEHQGEHIVPASGNIRMNIQQDHPGDPD